MSELEAGHGVRIPLAEVELRATGSSGPGGQHANRSATRIEAILDVDACSALTGAQRDRVRRALGARVTATAQDTRSQARNRELALERLAAKLRDALEPPKPRRKTKPSRGAKRRRVEAKRRRSDTKRLRQKPGPDG